MAFIVKYGRFEDLPVWNAAAELGAFMIDWTDDPIFRGTGDLADQIQRATLSISNNIAEGFERGTTKELINFLYYAKGSAGEVRSMLGVMRKTKRFQSLSNKIDKAKSSVESISRQLNGWTNSLQNSDIPGPKFLTDESRADFERKQSQRRTVEELRRWKTEFEANLRAKIDRERQGKGET